MGIEILIIFVHIKMTMKKLGTFCFILVLLGSMVVGGVSCRSKVENDLVKLHGHWGCETYISCRTRDDGTEKWDTLTYEVGTNHGYELWFRQDGTGKLRLNDSPALIKEFSCTYELDKDLNQIVIHSSAWLYAIYGTILDLDVNEVRFDINTLNDSVLDVSWTNEISETKPFFEHFFLKKITN